ncbi:MAG: NAD-dependent epimerase/dehydratase family protein [Nocardioidaceae bacterium]|nr:NAD-dependent epimerase/dehydratase family protein [Nocardioidaceae bacterium]
MDTPLTWVVGAGGLLGSSTVKAFGAAPLWSPGRVVPWLQPHAGTVVTDLTREFLRAAGDRPWQVAWCAGAGVTGSTEQDLAREASVLDALFEGLGDASSPGALFLASSAGGVYAGSHGAPFTELSTPAPISPYGVAKLDLERRATAFSTESGVSLLVGRISNLYGPGQDLAKPQGLISQICRNHLIGQPISIFVPMDTLRDYLFADDCGALVVDGLARLRAETVRTGPGVHTKVLAAQQGVTIGQLIAELRRLVKRAPRVVHGSSATSRYQARDLRMRSLVWPELDRRTLTTLPSGIHRTLLGQLRQLQEAALV